MMKQPRYQTRAKKAQAACTATYRQGRRAYCAGLYLNHCMYKGFTNMRRAWVAGWMEVCKHYNPPPDADPFAR